MAILSGNKITDIFRSHKSAADANGASNLRNADDRLRVFLSYARENSTKAEELHMVFEAEGFDVLIDKQSIAPGEPWQERLMKLIPNADKMVALISRHWLSSEICIWEMDEALRHGKSVLPVLIDDINVATLPPQLKRLNLLFAREEDEWGQVSTSLLDTLPIDLQWEREKSRIDDLAGAWETAARPQRLLIFRDDAIAEMERWRDTTPRNAEPPVNYQLAFIASCRAAFSKRQRLIRIGTSVVAVAMLGLAGLAEFQRQTAVRNLSEAEAVTDFLDKSFAAVNPRERGRDVTFAEIMDEASREIEQDPILLRPTAEARLRDSIGWSYLQMGLYDDAKKHLSKAHALRDEAFGTMNGFTATSLYRLALVNWHLNDMDNVVPLYLEVLGHQRAIFGDIHPDVALTLNDLGWLAMLDEDFETANARYSEAIGIHEKLAPDTRRIGDYAEALNNFGSVKQTEAWSVADEEQRQTLFLEAEQYLRKAIELRDGGGAPASDLGESYSNLAVLLPDLGRGDEVEVLLKEAIELQTKHFGFDNYRTLISRGNLARYHFDQEQFEIAVEMYQQQLAAWVLVDGENQPHARDAMVSLGVSLVMLERYSEALPHLELAVELEMAASGLDDPGTRTALEWRDFAREMANQE